MIQSEPTKGISILIVNRPQCNPFHAELLSRIGLSLDNFAIDLIMQCQLDNHGDAIYDTLGVIFDENGVAIAEHQIFIAVIEEILSKVIIPWLMIPKHTRLLTAEIMNIINYGSDAWAIAFSDDIDLLERLRSQAANYPKRFFQQMYWSSPWGFQNGYALPYLPYQQSHLPF